MYLFLPSYIKDIAEAILHFPFRYFPLFYIIRQSTFLLFAPVRLPCRDTYSLPH